MTKAEIKKILIIQFRPFGDLILSTAGTELLKQHFPQAQQHFLAEPPFVDVLEEHPFIHKIIYVKKVTKIHRFLRFADWMTVRKEKYDLIIDYQNGSESRLFLPFSRAKYRLGWGKSKFDFLLNLKANYQQGVYAAIRNLAMLQPLGIQANSCQLYVTPSQKGIQLATNFFKENNILSTKVIGMAVGCRDAKKQWHLEGYVSLIKKMMALPNVHIILFYAPDELKDSTEVYDKVKCEQVSLYVPTGSLREVAALLQKLDLLICNEGSLNHLSCATLTKTLCLIGPSDTSMWSPQGYFPEHYHLDNDGKRWEKDFGLTVDTVFEKVCQIL